MTMAHPNVTITDESLTREDIERFYSKAHADVWELIRTAGLASQKGRGLHSRGSPSARLLSSLMGGCLRGQGPDHQKPWPAGIASDEDHRPVRP
jgi:hypothetical protein